MNYEAYHYAMLSSTVFQHHLRVWSSFTARYSGKVTEKLNWSTDSRFPRLVFFGFISWALEIVTNKLHLQECKMCQFSKWKSEKSVLRTNEDTKGRGATNTSLDGGGVITLNLETNALRRETGSVNHIQQNSYLQFVHFNQISWQQKLRQKIMDLTEP